MTADLAAPDELLAALDRMLRDEALSTKHGGGTYVRRFEQGFSRLLRVERALSLNSGTAALHAALIGLGVGPGDEVIVDPLLRFAAVAALRVGASPVFADLDPQSWLMDPESAARVRTARSRAIVATAFFGLPTDPCALTKATGGLPVIEDCAQALLARRDGRTAGCGVAAGVFSFQSSKHLSTGEGGMMVTADPEVALRALELREHGWRPGRRSEDCGLGWMYRMPEPCAAIGAARLAAVTERVAQHTAIGCWLDAAIEDIAWLSPQAAGPEVTHARWRWGAAAESPKRLANLLQRLQPHEPRLEVGFCHPGPIYLRSFLQDLAAAQSQPWTPGLCPVAERLTERLLHLRIDLRHGEAAYQRLAEQLHTAARAC
ncbi:MAG: DegT/DnrJ/EryC1/StrS family aminotransferase [Methylocystis sp.]|uniref:DegT/DnrJ/EryC1/StrS family aminotransferase n=1 Tax=Phenylobacterium sp. TaxID=1871053 RepID=UPI00260086F5|nr:DegT/DnrJ/EryC1/StrS family aminotransferase [Phenylobacterium sp.]MCA3585163.1 DegT/DnrJ/EryC1/StrS family aminotransferase [Methylocystis sp.]MCA6286266.1 DegT/DnrJ/EryC1/StrS family aminotransferase [Phenylobacterium sp.]MCA6289322.1 DegT/DnrJ/EryC1/StrS family aminotransferase [Phenylobacterium sp.]MCA6346648.1 DegT/DnrJ/EryC1/StrS family aminotransferase [Phenylobacterium sp.]MCA6349244.1 DegT/DnrJ/EryC1/StrS family aminotransferase [Phenylobacterium sp.]